MGTEIKFNQEAISQGQETFDYSWVKISEEQRKVVTDAAKLFIQYLPFNEMVMTGHILIAMRKFQENNKINLSKITTITVAERINQVKEVNSILKANLSKFLIKPEMQPVLDEVIEKATNFVVSQLENLKTKIT